MIKFLDKSYIMGERLHRGGWPYVIRSLLSATSGDGILVDDFVEQTFGFSPAGMTIAEPWVGIFHHPHNMPSFMYAMDYPVEKVLESAHFQQSLPNMKLGVALSSPLAEWLQTTLDTPFVALRLPVPKPDLLFDPDLFLSNPNKRIIQIGCTCRNTSAIFQLPPINGYTKTLLAVEIPWFVEHIKQVQRLWRYFSEIEVWFDKDVSREDKGRVQTIHRVVDQDFDALLSNNVVFVEYFVAAASTTIVECVVRNTPIVVNRLPALEEYLGEAYPLFFDSFDEAPRLFATDKILEGHLYLKQLDKNRFTVERFRGDLLKAVSEAD